jgi:hypothetical protein
MGQTTAASVDNGALIGIAICFNLLWRSATETVELVSRAPGELRRNGKRLCA